MSDCCSAQCSPSSFCAVFDTIIMFCELLPVHTPVCQAGRTGWRRRAGDCAHVGDRALPKAYSMKQIHTSTELANHRAGESCRPRRGVAHRHSNKHNAPTATSTTREHEAGQVCSAPGGCGRALVPQHNHERRPSAIPHHTSTSRGMVERQHSALQGKQHGTVTHASTAKLSVEVATADTSTANEMHTPCIMPCSTRCAHK